MIDHDDAIEAAAGDLDEARLRIEDARDALRRAIDNGGESEATRRLAARLDRMAAEVGRIERVCAERSPAVSEVG
ncbi:hypothetical protein [Tautonia plasticadhaerens]|uniref:Uncharacterized protein n=1 Tax=Tautonia plasticadhaerens TaxID=2527974 RepID=A0A518H683_9BACT|nr:hypothetical protein [Tautonia plasticadhaerens]QDV36346.1 hypothetical protein ElP_42660 [Tautonia plasticadhaerens]